MAKKATSRKNSTTKTTCTRAQASKPAAKPAAKPAGKTVTKRAAKSTATAKAESPEEAAPAVMDRRSEGQNRRKATDRRQNDTPVAVERRQSQRRKVPRRRQIDPTTCERDYSNDEIEFMNALDQYKRANGRMFPTCSEILEVVRNLGYERRPPVVPMAQEVGEVQDRTALELTAEIPSIEVPADLRAELEPQL